MYVTFTALAMTVALGRDATHASVGSAAPTVVLTVIGTLLAAFVAEVIAHMVRESALPSRAELARMLAVSFVSLGVTVVPIAILGLSALDVIEVPPHFERSRSRWSPCCWSWRSFPYDDCSSDVAQDSRTAMVERSG